jgi:polyhydroxyalkanoate synthesis regulator phasin
MNDIIFTTKNNIVNSKFDRLVDDLVEDDELPDFQTSVESTTDEDLEIIKYNESMWEEKKERSFEDILLNITG